MQDINKDLDSIANEKYIRDTFVYARKTAPVAYTLVDADYKLSSNADIVKYKNFSATLLPKDYLPEILNKKFTAADAFEMKVTYNYYSNPVVDSTGSYVITEADYLDMGQTYLNFSDKAAASDLIGKLLNRKVYASVTGVEKTVKYTYYTKSIDRFIRVNADSSTLVLNSSSNAYKLDSNDYAALGHGKYDNFDDIAQAQELVVDLAGIRSHTLPLDYSCLVYKNYLDTYLVYLFNGTNWVVKQSLMAVSEPLNYSLDKKDITKSTWWADPAIKIKLGTADYNLYTETSKYQNFDLRGSIIPGTDRAKLVEMIGAMLDANHNPVDAQQYLVTYSYYDGSNGITTIRIIRTSGVWSEYSN
jgi:hypothetical protein